MGQKWRCEHMCDEGVQEVVDGLSKAIMDVVADNVQGMTPESVQQMVALVSQGSSFPAQNRCDFRDVVQDVVIKELATKLEPAFESVIEAIDDHMEEVHREGISRGEESIVDSGDYVYFEDVPEDLSDEVHDLNSRIVDLEDERDDLESRVSELENEAEERTDSVQPHSFVEPLSWNAGRQVFVCPKTGQAYKLVESPEICTSC